MSRRSTFVLFALCFSIIACAAPPAGAQAATSTQAPAVGIARFDIPETGLKWEGTPQPSKYFDATGRRAAMLGRQDGTFESWIYPIKVAHGFELEFQQDGMIEPVTGESCLKQLIARPESTTLVYVHPLFTVREIFWVPRDEAASVIFFDIDSNKPLTITMKFVPDFQPMWPASLGGQYTYWMPKDHAFGLSDGTGVPVAMIGSPAVNAYTDFVDIGVINGGMELKLRATAEQARAQFIPVVFALSMKGEAEAREVFHRVLDHAGELYQQDAAYHRDLLARTLQIETPDPDLNRAFAWAKVALDAGWVCNDTYGCGLVAGYGQSGSGERPGFDWWFGGDALMASWALEDYGDVPGALQALRFLKARQREDGKMMHEMTQSVGLIDWFGKYHYAYYHADTTPFYLYSLGQYWRRTGDKAFVDEFWESAKKAYAYCLTTLDPRDGLMDNTKAGLGAVEAGVLRSKVVKDIYLEGAWLGGLQGMEDLATAEGDAQLAADAKNRFAKASNSLRTRWWNPDGKFFAFGQTEDGRRDDMVSAWSSAVLALTPEFQDQWAAGDIAKLASPDLATDWGERTIGNKTPYYDQLSYPDGTAWPFLDIFLSWAEYAHGNPVAGFASWSNGARLTGNQAPGDLPEHMNGDRYLAGEHSVPHQLFSSVGVVVPAVRGLLGLTTTIENGRRVLRFRPQPRPDWSFLRFSGYVEGRNRVSGEVDQQQGRTILRLNATGSEPMSADVAVPIPLLAKIRRVTLNGRPVKLERKQVAGTNSVQVSFDTGREAVVTAEFDGGIGIVPPTVDPLPGDRTTSLKVMQISVTAPDSLELDVAGRAGGASSLDLVTALPKITADGATVQKTTNGYRLVVPFKDSDYAMRVIRIRAGH
ncbi:MAG TPA: GH116 family glycosyl hydrolase [Candidatus Acidoferrales bacterium]|nr:GH116 family glycosyl hydrolase [Candidatus Acidoferrales bacterium]